MSSDAPKLIIDSDWKNQAQAEKQRLEQQAAAKKPAAGAEGDELPQEIGILHLVEMLSMQALSYMGAVPDPRTGQAMISLEYAKLHIELLSALEEKTKGNLNEQEQAALSGSVSELRMHFVTIQQAVAKAVAEGRIKPGAGGMGGTISAGGPMGGPMGGAGGPGGGGPKGPSIITG